MKKKVLCALSTGMLACTLVVAPITPIPVAHADFGNVWNAVWTAYGTAKELEYQYETARDRIVSWGNIPSEQDKYLTECVNKSGGLDTNVEHNERVTRVLNSLLENGNYVRKPNQLPFRWRVVNSND